MGDPKSTKEPSPEKAHYLPALDGVRGIAILLVMAYHFTVLKPTSPLGHSFLNLIALGAHGVDLFFVLSGFLITGILLSSKGSENFFRNFYMRRTLRIFPLYYVVVVLTFLALPGLLHMIPAGREKLAKFAPVMNDWPWYICYLSNLLICKMNAFRHGVLDVTWSLAIEEQFYLCWAPLVFFLSMKSLERLTYVMIGTALVSRTVLFLGGASWLQVYVLTPCRMDALAMGAAIAVMMRTPGCDPRRTARLAKIAACIAALVLALFLLSGFRMDGTSTLYGTVWPTAIGIVFSGVLIGALQAPPGSLSYRFYTLPALKTLGKYSYAIYLLHLPTRAVLRDVVFGALLRDGPLIVLWQMIFYVTASLVTLCFALASWHLVEQPFLNLKKYFPSGRSERASGGRAQPAP